MYNHMVGRAGSILSPLYSILLVFHRKVLNSGKIAFVGPKSLTRRKIKISLFFYSGILISKQKRFTNRENKKIHILFKYEKDQAEILLQSANLFSHFLFHLLLYLFKFSSTQKYIFSYKNKSVILYTA